MEGWVSNQNTFQLMASNVGSMGLVRFRKYLILEIRYKIRKRFYPYSIVIK